MARTSPRVGPRPFEIVLCVAVVGVFAPAWLAMSEVWSRLDYYSHGYLVGPVAVLAGWSKRRALARLPAGLDLRGAALLALAVAGALFGAALDNVALQGVCLVAGVAGGFWLARGPGALSLLRFPIGYLLFLVPIPEAWLNPVIVKLQFFVSAVGVGVVRVLGIPVLRNGNVLELPEGGELFVAEACSGITSIVTLVPLAAFLAYFTLRGNGQRWLLVASVLPLALAGNLLRVVGTVLAAQEIGPERATAGSLHDAVGVAAYVVACLALLGIGALIRRVFDPLPDSA